MRCVLQRVVKASVSVHDKVCGSIKTGLLVLVGFENNDTEEDVEWLSKKITQIRIFNDPSEIMNLSVKEIGGNILLISQFTLHASTKKGNRPSYLKASKSERAIPLYLALIRKLSAGLGKDVECGIFGADMKVSLINDGPVTIVIDTKNKE
ncbi:MAG: D-aminoacyl-tRNA deacylase [Flavisolibacter sp.]